MTDGQKLWCAGLKVLALALAAGGAAIQVARTRRQARRVPDAWFRESARFARATLLANREEQEHASEVLDEVVAQLPVMRKATAAGTSRDWLRAFRAQNLGWFLVFLGALLGTLVDIATILF